MPSYLYRCSLCKEEEIIQLPISSDPNQCLLCAHCAVYSKERKIRPCNNIIMKKSTLGAWFKKKTGRELLGPEPKDEI